MLEEPFLTSSQSRKESAQNIQNQHPLPRVQRVANSLVVQGKVGSMRDFCTMLAMDG